ncbi:MAG: APC family permease [Candidatus Methanofastidiosia archaeon]
MVELKLKKELSSLELVALGSGAMIGSLWIYYGGSWTYESGTLGAIIAFILAAVLCGFVGLTYAELTSAMPKAGGELGWSLKGLGTTGGFVTYWCLLLAYLMLAVIYPVLFVFIAKLTGLIPWTGWIFLWTIEGMEVYVSDIIIGMLLMLVFTAICYYGIKISGMVQKATFLILLGIGVWAVVSALVLGNPANMKPMIKGLGPITWTMLLAPGFMVGFDIIPQLSEEAKIPAKKIGKLILVTIGVTTFFYCIVCLASGLAADEAARSVPFTGLVTAMPELYGVHWVIYILLLGSIMGIVTTWNGFIAAGSRLMYAGAKARFLPPVFDQLNKHSVPHIPLYVFVAVALIGSFLGAGITFLLIACMSLFIVFAWLFVSISFVKLRYKAPDMKRPYKVKYGVPVGIIAAIICALWFLIYFPPMPEALAWPKEWAIPIIWVVLGVVMWLWQRTKYKDVGSEERINAVLAEYAE